MTKQKVVYLAALLALATAATLAWAVSHPCDCESEDVQVEVAA